MFGFININPDWVEKQCEIKRSTSKKEPIILLNELSYQVLMANEHKVLKRQIQENQFRGYEVQTDNSLDFGICRLITKEDKQK